MTRVPGGSVDDGRSPGARHSLPLCVSLALLSFSFYFFISLSTSLFSTSSVRYHSTFKDRTVRYIEVWVVLIVVGVPVPLFVVVVLVIILHLGGVDSEYTVSSVKLEPLVVTAERQSYHVPAEDFWTGHRRTGDSGWTSGSLYQSVGSAH